MWAVLYDDGMSLTTASELIARSLAEAERQRGRRVTIQRLDDAETHPRGADSVPEPEPIRPVERFARPEPISEPGPAPAPEPAQALEPVQAAEPASAPEPASEASPTVLAREAKPARAPTPARRRRLLLYALAAAAILVAAALADHSGALPRVGANTSSSSTQVGGPPHSPWLLPPLEQPPVMHFGNAVDARLTPAEPSAQPTSPAAQPSGAQNPAARPAGSPTSAGSPQTATGESSGGAPSPIARGG